MQGFSIDGKKVSKIKLMASMSCENVSPGPHRNDLPHVAVTFYDTGRKTLSTSFIGPMQGTMPWKNRSLEIRVPIAAKEAIVRIGLFGATGKASYDRLSISAVKE